MVHNVWRYVLLPRHRGGTRFCHHDDVLDYSFRNKVVAVCKNRDTKSECPAAAGPACAAITSLSWWLQGFRGTVGSCIYRPVACCPYSFNYS